MKIPQNEKQKAKSKSNKQQQKSQGLTVAWYATALTVTSLETTVVYQILLKQEELSKMERKVVDFLLLLLTLSICACCPGVVAFAPPPIRSRIATSSSTQSKSSSLNAIPLFPGAEDIIFNAQNAASTLANSVISTSGASAGAAGQLQSLVLLYIAG